MPVILYFASILLTCALSGFLAVYAWRQRNVPGSRAYAGLALGECLLALAEILSMLSPSPAQALFWFQVRYTTIAPISVFWLVFALEYSGRKDWLSKHLLAGMFIVPVITQVLLWSNSLHGLWAKQEVGFYQNGSFWIAEIGARLPALGYLAHSFYSMLLLLTGIVLLLVAAWRMRREYRGQALLVAGAASTAFAFAINSIFNLNPQTEFNLFTPGIGLSVLLIALAVFRFQFLKRAPAADAGSAAQALVAQSKRSLAEFLLLFVLMAAGITATAYVSYQDYEQRFRHQVKLNLSSIATLKVDGLQNWRKERLADAEILNRNPAFSALVQRYLENPSDARAQAVLQSWLDRYHAYEQYDRVFLLDARGVERLSAPPAPEPVAACLTQEAAAILSAGQVIFLDFHRDTVDGSIHLAILVPIFAEQDGNRPLGILGLRMDPHMYLYPFIQQWPVPSASAETLLVRREGTDALYLNELKFRANTALNLRVPLENTQVLAVKAALGQVGVVEGVDYRGAPVIGDVRAVPGSPWFLVTRVDNEEVYAPLRERLWQTAAFFGALIATFGAALGLVWRQQRVRYYRGQFESAQALRESLERFQLANRATFNVIWDWNLQTDTLWWNENFQTLFDYQPEEIEPGIESWTSRMHPEDLKRVETGIHAAIDSGREYWFDHYLFRRKDGQYAEIEDRGYISREASGKPVRMIGAMQDITERKRAEEALRESEAHYRTLIESVGEGIGLVNPQDQFTFANPAGEDIFSVPPGGLPGRSLREFTTPEQFDEIREQTRQRQVGEKNVYEIEISRSDGENRCLLVTAVPQFDSQGEFAGTFGVFRDITERKRQEAQILAAQAELQRLLAEAVQSRRALLSVVEDQKAAQEETRRLNAELEQRVRDRTAQLQAVNKELEAFAYSVSHDLRAPLRALDGFSAALLSNYADQVDEQARHYLNRIQEASRRMGQLINDLLNLSRITRSELTRQRVDLSALAHEIAAELEAREPQRLVEFAIADRIIVQGDAPLLRIALENLMNNAWKFTSPRAPAHIEIGAMEHNGGRAVSVRDNGVGFDMAYADKLFAPFQRLHATHEFPGTGIGLATVQRIIARHGGRVWAEAAVDQGATFYFILGGT